MEGLYKSPGPILCSKYVHWEHIAQHLVCLSFENLQNLKIHGVSRHSIPVFDLPYGQLFSPYIQPEFLMLHAMHVASCPTPENKYVAPRHIIILSSLESSRFHLYPHKQIRFFSFSSCLLFLSITEEHRVINNI